MNGWNCDKWLNGCNGDLGKWPNDEQRTNGCEIKIHAIIQINKK